MEDDLFDVFRDDKPSLIWVGSTDSMDAAWELIKSKAVVPGERFIIYGVVTHNRFYLRDKLSPTCICCSHSRAQLPGFVLVAADCSCWTAILRIGIPFAFPSCVRDNARSIEGETQ